MTDVAVELMNTTTGLRTALSVSSPTIEGSGYDMAELKNGKWVLYDGEGYPSSGKYQILDTLGEQSLNFSPKSAKSLAYQEEALVLFSHPHFAGKERLYTSADTDITNDFPQNPPDGVSSLIVWPAGTWTVYNKPGLSGSYADMGTGYHANPTDIPVGEDQIASVAPKH